MLLPIRGSQEPCFLPFASAEGAGFPALPVRLVSIPAESPALSLVSGLFIPTLLCPYMGVPRVCMQYAECPRLGLGVVTERDSRGALQVLSIVDWRGSGRDCRNRFENGFIKLLGGVWVYVGVCLAGGVYLDFTGEGGDEVGVGFGFGDAVKDALGGVGGVKVGVGEHGHHAA